MKEFKIIELDRGRAGKGYGEAEAFLAEKAAEGWTVVSVAMDTGVDIRGKLLVTLERERK